jgi:hypothetical protein
MLRLHKGLPIQSYEGRDQLFTVAAPVLAGFSVTLLGILISLNPPTLVRWRDLALLLATTSAFLYLASMRYALSGRILRITRQDAEATWDTRANQLKGFQAYAVVHDRLIAISQLVFALASIALGAGLTVLMIPSGPLGHIGTVRLLAITAAGLSTLAQGIQTLAHLGNRRFIPSWLAPVVSPHRKVVQILRECGLASHKGER